MRPPAEVEIQRILAIVPWIVAHPGAKKADVAARFGITVDQLDEHLGLVLMIGVPPYSPGDYIDVDDDDEHVTLRMAESFRRPLQLSPTEGVAVLAAGRALLAVPGSEAEGPLASALEKLAVALGSPDVRVDVPTPANLDALLDAADRGERVEIDYWSAGRAEVTTRVIDPQAVFFAAGEWYVDAYCRRAEAPRLFRVDRVRDLRPTGEHFEAVPGAPLPAGRGADTAHGRVSDTAADQVFTPRANDPRVTLDVSPTASWVVEQVPVESVTTLDDGWSRIVLAVSEPAFLERLLLRLGPDARLVDDDHSGISAPEAAGRVLARYRVAGAGHRRRDTDRGAGGRRRRGTTGP
jgi:proteasome accessory factor C